MTDETIPLDACCQNCKYYIHYTNPAWRICVAPKIVKNGFMVHVDDNHVCRECELLQKVQLLEQAGDRIVKLVNEVYAMMGGPCMLQDAVKEWEKTREE